MEWSAGSYRSLISPSSAGVQTALQLLLPTELTAELLLPWLWLTRANSFAVHRRALSVISTSCHVMSFQCFASYLWRLLARFWFAYLWSEKSDFQSLCVTLWLFLQPYHQVIHFHIHVAHCGYFTSVPLANLVPTLGQHVNFAYKIFLNEYQNFLKHFYQWWNRWWAGRKSQCYIITNAWLLPLKTQE